MESAGQNNEIFMYLEKIIDKKFQELSNKMESLVSSLEERLMRSKKKGEKNLEVEKSNFLREHVGQQFVRLDPADEEEGKETKRKQIKDENGNGIPSQLDFIESLFSFGTLRQEELSCSNKVLEEEEKTKEKDTIKNMIKARGKTHYTYEFLCLKEERLEDFLKDLIKKKKIKFDILGSGIEQDNIHGKYTVALRFVTAFSIIHIRSAFLANYADIEINDLPKLRGKHCKAVANLNYNGLNSSIIASVSQQQASSNINEEVLSLELQKFITNSIKEAREKKKKISWKSFLRENFKNYHEWNKTLYMNEEFAKKYFYQIKKADTPVKKR